MVTIIQKAVGIREILGYNEDKLNEGRAVCIHAANFWEAPEQLDREMKAARFERRMALNTRVVKNARHITINFHPSDVLSNERLAEIANLYMEKIGFGRQPYLVYQHLDAGHPHLHIPTTTIRADGKNVDMNFILIRRSEPARKEIEIRFGLVQAGKKDLKARMHICGKPTAESVCRVEYGKTPTMEAIGQVVNMVADQFHYRSLAELNAILRVYHVMADPGSPGTRMRQNRGLIYQCLDEEGRRMGKPVKASVLYGKPVLDMLERKMAANLAPGDSLLQRMAGCLDYHIQTRPFRLTDFVDQLRREGISLVRPLNRKSHSSETFYVDFRNKSVSGDRELGEKYSYGALTERYMSPANQALCLEEEERMRLGRSHRLRI